MSEDTKKPDDIAPAPTPGSEDKPAKFSEASLKARGWKVPPSKEPTMADQLRAAGFKVPEPRGEGFTIGWNGPPNMRPKPSSK